MGVTLSGAGIIDDAGMGDIGPMSIERMMEQARNLSDQLSGLFKKKKPDAIHEAHRLQQSELLQANLLRGKNEDDTRVETDRTKKKLEIAVLVAQLAHLLYQLYQLITSGTANLSAAGVTALMKGLDHIADPLRKMGFSKLIPEFSTVVA